MATGFGAGGRSSSFVSGLGSGAGVSSTVLCFPVVQGGMARNSSNVRNWVYQSSVRSRGHQIVLVVCNISSLSGPREIPVALDDTCRDLN
jgi:hypothetical protein